MSFFIIVFMYSCSFPLCRKSKAGTKYRSLLNEGETVSIDTHGWGRFFCKYGSVDVWVQA